MKLQRLVINSRLSINLLFQPKLYMTSQSPSPQEIYKKIQNLFSNHPDKSKNMIIQVNGPRMTIKYNRPKRYNAFTIDMYLNLTQAINSAQIRDDIKFIVLMGEGGNFSSGNDLNNFTNPQILGFGGFKEVITASSIFLHKLTKAIIQSKKPIVALTEGKVIGFAFTKLALFDKVFSVQSSSFVAPLVSSGQGPELCASWTFPKIFGNSVAQELIMFGKPVDSDFLEKYKFVEKCKSREDAEQKLNEYLQKIDELDWESYSNGRRLFREREEKILLEVAERQIENLVQRWMNPDLMSIIAKHMQRMKKWAKL